MFIEITDYRLSNRKTLINVHHITKLVPQKPMKTDAANCIVFMVNDFVGTTMTYDEVKDLIEKAK